MEVYNLPARNAIIAESEYLKIFIALLTALLNVLRTALFLFIHRMLSFSLF